jgi:hypothetical protein
MKPRKMPTAADARYEKRVPTNVSSSFELFFEVWNMLNIVKRRIVMAKPARVPVVRIVSGKNLRP